MQELSKEMNPNEWIDAHGDVLFAYAISKLRNRELAEDVVQETFLSAVAHRDQFWGVGTVGAWLMGILKRKVVDQHRSKARQPLSIDKEDSVVASLFDERGNWAASARKSSASAFSMDRLQRSEFRRLLEKCLEKLPDGQAESFRLKEIQQKSGEEVCKVLGISTSNLWVLMHRARLRLAECIKTRWGLGDS